MVNIRRASHLGSYVQEGAFLGGLLCSRHISTSPPLVMCEYSKFRIESNSYLLFNSIRNWRNYSKFSNTYLTVISRAIDSHLFVLCQPQAAALTWHWTQCCATAAACVPTPPTPLSALRACAQRQGIWPWHVIAVITGGSQTQRMVSWALALLSVFLWIQL